MSKADALVLTKQYSEAKTEWHKTLANGENLSILFPPISDAVRRISQFIEEYGNNFVFLEIDPVNPGIEEISDLESNLLAKAKQIQKYNDIESFENFVDKVTKEKKKIVVTCLLGDMLFNIKSQQYLPLFTKVFFKYNPNVVFLMAFETNIQDSENGKVARYNHLLFQHVTYYPLYKPLDTKVFVNYLINKWSLKIDIKKKNEIIKKCGGYFWLIKEAIREIRDTGAWNQNSEIFSYRLKTIAGSLSQTEYTALTKVLTKSRSLSEEEILSLDYLKKIGIVGSGNKLNTPLLQEEIIKLGSSKRKLVLEKDGIFLNQVPVSKYFSRKEFRVVKLLLAHRGEVVSRDEIAEAIWPMAVEENFSEWAIDQLIKRLRERMSELLIPKTVLKSVRGKGYLYAN